MLNMGEYTKVKQQFNIIFNNESRILILGSFPSVKSREYGFYYMNPKNRFWFVLSSLLKIDLISLSKEDKTKILLDNHIALYDVIEECDIIGSSDSSIKNVKYLDIDYILNNSKITKIFLNGNKAYSLFINKFPHLKDIAYKLPSTSPANAKTSLEELINVYKIILE